MYVSYAHIYAQTEPYAPKAHYAPDAQIHKPPNSQIPKFPEAPNPKIPQIPQTPNIIQLEECDALQIPKCISSAYVCAPAK